jgi:hypothetical protein
MREFNEADRRKKKKKQIQIKVSGGTQAIEGSSKK